MKKQKSLKFKESVGIDLGSHSVKVVHLRRLSEGFKLLNYEIRPTVAHGVEYIPGDLRPERYGPVLVDIFKTLRINPKECNTWSLLLEEITPASNRSKPSFFQTTSWNRPSSLKPRNTSPFLEQTWCWTIKCSALKRRQTT